MKTNVFEKLTDNKQTSQVSVIFVDLTGVFGSRPSNLAMPGFNMIPCKTQNCVQICENRNVLTINVHLQLSSFNDQSNHFNKNIQ